MSFYWRRFSHRPESWMTVSIRVDYDSEGWKQKAERCLEAGAVLIGVPEELLDDIRQIAKRADIDVSIEERDEAYRVSPSPDAR